MECAKLIASFFVVFIHVPFPGRWGILADYLGRFAVPMFFAISGYFNYRADSAKVLKRTKHILRLYIIAVAAHILWACIVTELEGGSTVARLIKSIPDPDEFSRWLIVQTDPFSGHLWYLNSAIVTYLVYWLYVRFWEGKPVNYTPLYYAAFMLFVVYFAFEVITPVGSGVETVFSSRNAWFTGIPMFTLGIFIRQYQEQIFRNFPLRAWQLSALIVVGILLVIQQWDALESTGMPFGTLLIIAGLMLLLVSHPTITRQPGLAQTLILKCGAWSTWIYILHQIVDGFYEMFCQPHVAAALADAEPWLHPIIIVLMSFLPAIAAERIDWYCRRILRKKS